jgi:two-component system response regulator HupR/HoxA
MAAKCDYPTLILGETGAGKELVAKCIHAASVLGDRSIVVADCGSTVDALLESELFGHEKGAFTGAHDRHSGVFERANGSSLVLDEVDSMSPRMQVALLRVLETGEYRPVGSATSKKSTFRVISAALPRLIPMLETGQFRQDLYYRIGALKIDIPPLRSRDGDAAEIAIAYARSLGFRLTSGAIRAIGDYGWPGNVRQLRHCVEAASLRGQDGRISESALAEIVAGFESAATARRSAQDRGSAAWNLAIGRLEQRKTFGVAEFAEAAKLSKRSAQRHIARLLREGYILRVGAGRATCYEVQRDRHP